MEKEIKFEREPNTEYVLSLSYGKDSLACLGAIEKLGLPLDRIVHAEIWFNDEIPADLPPMVEFKKKADAIIKARWGIDVEHVCAIDKATGEKQTYEKMFYRVVQKKKTKPKEASTGESSTSESLPRNARKLSRYKPKDYEGRIYGFPMIKGIWCNSDLKVSVLEKSEVSQGSQRSGVLSGVQANSKRMDSHELFLLSPMRSGRTQILQKKLSDTSVLRLTSQNAS